MKMAAVKAKGLWKRGRLKNIKKHWRLLIFVLPALIYVFIFMYLPMYGIIISFEDYKPHLGYLGSPWVGLKHFKRFFTSPNFWPLFKNTVSLSVMQLILTFPLPIILALAINQLRNKKFQKFAQLITYAPHFISVVVLVSVMRLMLDPQTGVINHLLTAMGMEPQFFMGNPQMFRWVYVLSDVWQSTGWNSIIYFAALASVDLSMHEAAIVDGATDIQRIRYIDLPSIMPTVITLLILNTGKIMGIGFEKVYAMQNALNLSTSQIIPTYVYQVGILEGQYSYSSAINLFNSFINLALLLTVNHIAKKTNDTSIL
ncbi:ABC transporter permease [Hungatella sp. SB206]|uniref:ABC transporter permease n=1 Tax=Hungatella sp. SB206 TaxID=2937758 RepID=UPI003DA92D09